MYLPRNARVRFAPDSQIQHSVQKTHPKSVKRARNPVSSHGGAGTAAEVSDKVAAIVSFLGTVTDAF